MLNQTQTLKKLELQIVAFMKTISQKKPKAPIDGIKEFAKNLAEVIYSGLLATEQEVNNNSQGSSGKQIELQNSGTYIQWRYVGDITWIDLVALSAITGTDGDDGREIELQNSGTFIQWRYVGDISWINLIDIADITGADGDDGREVELQTNATHIQWRYVGSGSWTDLIALSLITGADGQDGRVLFLETHTDVVGTATAAEELLYVFTIPGGTVVDGDSIDLQVLGTFASTSGSDKTFKIRVDTSATGITGTVVAQFQSNNSSGNTIPLKIYQDIKCKQVGSPATQTLETAYTSSGAFSQGFLAILSTPNINLANTWYIKITSDKAVSGDTMTLKYANVIVNKKI